MTQIEYDNYSNSHVTYRELSERRKELPPLTRDILRVLYTTDIKTHMNTYLRDHNNRRIRLCLDPDYVNMRDTDNFTMSMHMSRHSLQYLSQVTCDRDIMFPGVNLSDTDQILSGIFKTTHSGQHHPVLYAKEIFMAQYNFLLRHGHIDGFLGRWINEPDFSTNYNAYQSSLKHQSIHTSVSLEEQRKIAAFQTWTGMQLRRLGFTTCHVTEQIYADKKIVFALFTK
jgi:hypothetical protein